MIQLNYRNIQNASITHLSSVQQDINGEATYEAKAKKAKSKWASKASSFAAQAAFSDIKGVLKDMCSGSQICVYCEHNEATDIEHIYPKRLYPEKTFTWANYVFACGNCNSHYKGENFKIFNPVDTSTTEDITPLPTTYVQPTNDDAVFINQRVENPMELLELNILDRLYIYRERHAPGTREYEKAKYTKDVLGLNERADLVKQRKAAHVWYISELGKYVVIKNATNFDELKVASNDENIIIETALYESEKQKVLAIVKKEILSHSHPTVLRELIRQRGNLPTANSLFEQAPEILTWHL
jgi:hypothetical protein